MSDNSNVTTKSWSTKYRPYTMEQYKGDNIRDIVKRRFSSKEKRPNVVLVYGKRGCGKTTFSRIISKYYLCQNPHEDGTPCEECEMCRSINEILIGGETGVECPGVTEINAAHVNGIDAINEVIEEALIAPLYTEKKIVIFDECHRISPQAQNALLKVIEDIPSHLVIIFATTDVDNVLPTIKSRCSPQIEVRKQSVEVIADRLMEISKLENLTVSREALEIIARKKDRILRDSVALLEDVSKQFDGQVTVKNVLELTQDISSKMYMDFYKAANSSLEDILLFNKSLSEKDISINEFASGLMKFTMEAIYTKHGISLEEQTPDFVKEVKKLFKIYTSGDFDTLLQILEYFSKMLTSDEYRNEVLLTTTALRISKIQLIAEGLTHEQERAVDENKRSLVEYTQGIEKKTEIVKDDFSINVNEDTIAEEFGGTAVAYDASELMRSLASSERLDTSTGEIIKEEEVISNDDIDDFFND